METLMQRERIRADVARAEYREGVTHLFIRHVAKIINDGDLDLGALFSASYLGVWGLYFVACGVFGWNPPYLMPLFRHIDSNTLAVIFLAAGSCQLCGLVVSVEHGQHRLRTWGAGMAGLLWLLVSLMFVQSSLAMLPLFVGHILLALACLNGFRRFRAMP